MGQQGDLYGGEERIESMSLRAYARHRGVSAAAVVKAIADRRLVASVRRTTDGAPRIADPDLADREWAANTDPTRVPMFLRDREGAPSENGGGDAPSVDEGADVDAEAIGFNAAAALDKMWSARLKELEYRSRVSKLVDARAVQGAARERIALARAHLLTLPSKWKAAVPHLTADDLATCDRLIRSALEGLDEPLFADSEAIGHELDR